MRAGSRGDAWPLVAWAAGRPFVRVDDEIGDADRHWVAAHRPERALLLRVDHRHGITSADLDAVGAWWDVNRQGHQGAAERAAIPGR